MGEKWIDKSGKKWNVDDMSDSHVRNCFKLLLRRINQRNDHRESVVNSTFMDVMRRETAQLEADYNNCDATVSDIY